MPKFDNLPEPNGNGKHKKEVGPPAPRGGVPDIVEPRCHCCTHDHRRVIDRLIAIATPYKEIERLFGVDYRSVSGHAKKHLRYEEAAILAIVEREAKLAEENAEEGVSRATARRVFLETYVQKTRDALITGQLELSGKDAMAAIQMLDAQDQKRQGASIDEIMGQFGAFQQAIREICEPEVWDRIRVRTREIYVNTVEGQIVDPKQIEE